VPQKFSCHSYLFRKILAARKQFDAAHWKNDVTRFQFHRTFSSFIRSRETFPPRTSSIRGQPLIELSAARSKNNPAVAAAGL
jgi:hypothetical protein